MAVVINYIIWIISFGTYNPFTNNDSNDISDSFLLIDLNNKSLYTEEQYDKIIETNYKSMINKHKNNIEKKSQIPISLNIKNDILNYKFNIVKRERQMIEPHKPVNKYDNIVQEIKQKKQLKNTLIECEDGTKISMLDNSPETTEKIMKTKLIKIKTENPKTILDEIHKGVQLKKV